MSKLNELSSTKIIDALVRGANKRIMHEISKKCTSGGMSIPDPVGPSTMS